MFHDYGKQENGHGDNEWFKNRRDRFRKMSIARAKTALQMPDGDESETAQANLGLYGLGKRRTMEQFQEFTNINLRTQKGNHGAGDKCTNLQWVPYDFSISPMENLFDKPDNLDPQPEYPLRTEFKFYEQVADAPAMLDFDVNEGKEEALDTLEHTAMNVAQPNSPPASLIFVLWVFGLIVACVMIESPKSRKGGSRRKKAASAKDV